MAKSDVHDVAKNEGHIVVPRRELEALKPHEVLILQLFTNE